MKDSHHILLSSLVMTIVIFTVGIMLSYWLDFERIDEIDTLIQEHKIDNEAFLLEQGFLDSSGGSSCAVLESRIGTLSEEILNVGKDLSNYGDKSLFKKDDFDYLRRQFFLLQIQFYNLAQNLNRDCMKNYIPILFFYESDDSLSERQGFILEEISDAYRGEVFVLTIDKDYDKEPLVDYLVRRYNITKAPSMVIAGNPVIDRLEYKGEINATILKIKRKADPYTGSIDFDYVLRAAGIDKAAWEAGMEEDFEQIFDPFAKGDILYALGRVTDNDTLICRSLAYYDEFQPKTPEERALLFETYVSVGCGRNRKAFLNEAADAWEEAGNLPRADLDRKLANNLRLDLEFKNITLASDVSGYHALGRVSIGGTSLTIDRGDLILSQSDRVNRDWLSMQLEENPFSERLLTGFSETLTYDNLHLRPDIGWHEGARIKEMAEAGIPRTVATGTLLAKKNGKWYAPNEEGIFMFEIPIDKVSYPTTRFLTEDLAVVIDTHGISMLVEQAMRKNASLMIGCCDHPGKIAAAQYLGQKGKAVICFTDKYLPLILGDKGMILGNPPFVRNGNKITFGNRPIMIDISDTIVAGNVSDITTTQSYYDTPARYFSELSKYADIDVRYYDLSGGNMTYGLVDEARNLNSTTIGVRVQSYDDYLAVRKWLEDDPSHKAVMFHSYSYPYGYLLMNQYVEQTTFDDINPRII